MNNIMINLNINTKRKKDFLKILKILNKNLKIFNKNKITIKLIPINNYHNTMIKINNTAITIPANNKTIDYIIPRYI